MAQHPVIPEISRIIDNMITNSNNHYLDLWKTNSTLTCPTNRNIIALHYLDCCNGIQTSHAKKGQLLSPKLNRGNTTDRFYDITKAFKSDPHSKDIPMSLFNYKNFGEFVLAYLMDYKEYIYDKEQQKLVLKIINEVTTIQIDEPTDTKIREFTSTLKCFASKYPESKIVQIIDKYINELKLEYPQCRKEFITIKINELKSILECLAFKEPERKIFQIIDKYINELKL